MCSIFRPWERDQTQKKTKAKSKKAKNEKKKVFVYTRQSTTNRKKAQLTHLYTCRARKQQEERKVTRETKKLRVVLVNKL